MNIDSKMMGHAEHIVPFARNFRKISETGWSSKTLGNIWSHFSKPGIYMTILYYTLSDSLK